MEFHEESVLRRREAFSISNAAIKGPERQVRRKAFGTARRQLPLILTQVLPEGTG